MAVERGKTFSKPPSEHPINTSRKSMAKPLEPPPDTGPGLGTGVVAFQYVGGMIGHDESREGVEFSMISSSGWDCVRYLCRQILL